ncbi:MAG: hypothetical protein IKE69_09435 [Thermoguttaceae bacterium]|nr:hypothetical protein [Thermoguttaceae bacterium]
MNSKNFIIAVAVVISFFAACFVWEMRSALPESEGKDVSVGSCAGGQARRIVINACVYKPQKECESVVLYDAPVPFRCGHDVIVETLTSDCKHETSREPCYSSNGYSLNALDAGDYVQGNPASCGTTTVKECKDRITNTYPLFHRCPIDNKLRKINIDVHECFEKPNSATQESCGEKATVTGC